jgi:hypothetical protein
MNTVNSALHSGEEMAGDAEQERRPSRQWKWVHPLLLCGMAWLAGTLQVACGLLGYYFFARLFGSGRLPGVAPMPPIALGLCIGLVAIFWRKRSLQNRIEVESRALVFPLRRSDFRRRFSQVLPELLTHFLPLVVVYAVVMILRCAGVSSQGLSIHFVLMILFGGTFFLQALTYPERLQIYRQAERLATQSQEDTATYAPRAVEDIPTWPTIFGVSSIIAILALAAWLQWGLPAAMQREPKEYLTRGEQVGEAVQLTYNQDCTSPAISPDGGSVAFIRSGFPDNHLEVMRPNGSEKRRVSTEVSPGRFSPLRWSSDGSQILLVGREPFQPRSWMNVSEVPDVSEIWTVDVSTGKARRLTNEGLFLAAEWAPACRKIVGAKAKGGTVRLIVMAENGENAKEIGDLALPKYFFSFHSWHEGRQFVAVGAEKSPGIWLLETASGEVTRLSDLQALWAIPLDEARFIVAVPGTSYPPFKHATSIGILDPSSSEVRWVLKDIQGNAQYPAVLPEPPILFFVLNATGRNLWALPLPDGNLRRIASEYYFTSPAIHTKSRSIFYTAESEDDESHPLFPLHRDSIWQLTPHPAWETWDRLSR